jgi:hypothetical protein
MQHHAQDAVDAEPGVPEAGVGVVHFALGLRGLDVVYSASAAVRLSLRTHQRISRVHALPYIQLNI